MQPHRGCSPMGGTATPGVQPCPPQAAPLPPQAALPSSCVGIETAAALPRSLRYTIRLDPERKGCCRLTRRGEKLPGFGAFAPDQLPATPSALWGWAKEKQSPSERRALMLGCSAASRTTLNKSLFKGDAACVTQQQFPLPVLVPGLLAGGGSVRGQGRSLRGRRGRRRRVPAELLRPPPGSDPALPHQSR